MRLPRSLRVLSARITLSGSATLCRRAARFDVSPTTLYSRGSPEPSWPLTTTTPVAIPTRVCREAMMPVLLLPRLVPTRTALLARRRPHARRENQNRLAPGSRESGLRRTHRAVGSFQPDSYGRLA